MPKPGWFRFVRARARVSVLKISKLIKAREQQKEGLFRVEEDTFWYTYIYSYIWSSRYAEDFFPGKCELKTSIKPAPGAAAAAAAADINQQRRFYYDYSQSWCSTRSFY